MHCSRRLPAAACQVWQRPGSTTAAPQSRRCDGTIPSRPQAPCSPLCFVVSETPWCNSGEAPWWPCCGVTRGITSAMPRSELRRARMRPGPAAAAGRWLSAAAGALPPAGGCFAFTNGFEISLSPRLGTAGMRKWLLILLEGWRKKSPGSLSGGGCARDEDAISKALEPFCFAAAVAGGSAARWASPSPITRSRMSPTCDQHLPGSGDGSSGLAQAAPQGNPSVPRLGSCPLGNSPRGQVWEGEVCAWGRRPLCRGLCSDSSGTGGAFGFALSWLSQCCCGKQVPQGFPIREGCWLLPGPGGLWVRNRSVEGVRGERGLWFPQAG